MNQDRPILTPQMVISLRGINPEECHFDVAVLCFRGREGSDLLSSAFEVERREGFYLYGSEPYVSRLRNASVGRQSSGLDADGSTELAEAFRPLRASNRDLLCAGRRGEKQLVILPTVIWGGPVTAILLEELAVLGVKTAIGFGAAGSLVSPDHIGGLLIAKAALCRDGASREYTDAELAYPDPELLRLAVELSEAEGTSPILGTVHTTDALYRETPAKLRQWRGWGAEFVNLETGPFYAVASSLEMRAVYLGLVTDYVAEDREWQHGYWSRENPTDPLIVRVIRGLVEHERGGP